MPQGFKDAVARRMANVGRHLSPEVEVILLHKESLFQALIEEIRASRRENQQVDMPDSRSIAAPVQATVDDGLVRGTPTGVCFRNHQVLLEGKPDDYVIRRFDKIFGGDYIRERDEFLGISAPIGGKTTGLTFGEAMQAVAEGKTVKRSYRHASPISIGRANLLVWPDEDDAQKCVIFVLDDILATDWEIVQ